ncbi:hypothetical protein Tco_0615337 [Tanacetum coccineum]
MKKGTSQREVRPVWNNALRTNHQNFSNSRRNFAPIAVLTKSDLVPISTARQSSSRAASPVSTARPIKTVAPKPFENVVKSRPNAFQKVSIVKVNSVNIAKGKRVISVVGEQGMNAVKSTSCWVWRPKIKVGDEAVHKELGDRMERAATTASSFKTEQDSDAQTRFEAASKSPMIHLSQELHTWKWERRMKQMDLDLYTNYVTCTASATPEVSTAAEGLVYIRRSAKKKKDKGKAIMIEDESVQKKSKKQMQEERLGHEEDIRLQEQIDEGERKRIARDA